VKNISKKNNFCFTFIIKKITSGSFSFTFSSFNCSCLDFSKVDGNVAASFASSFSSFLDFVSLFSSISLS